jgi:deoxycytidylate deaminase
MASSLAVSAPSPIVAKNLGRPELIFGLIGALGADIAGAERFLRTQLATVQYDVQPTIKLTDLLLELSGEPFDKLSVDGKRARVDKFMDAGNLLRRRTERGEALAMLGVNALRAQRKARGLSDDETAEATAFIINSLKHPAEIRTLRRIYGPAFIGIAVYSQRKARVAATQDRLRRFHGSGAMEDYLHEAEELVKRDEDEAADSFGQHVSDTFSLADVIVGDSGTLTIKSDVERFIELLFGNWTWTPRVDETGMFFAQGARYRSASMARQVGAAVIRSDGTVISTGTNDVPKAGGGLYSESDRPDGRDHALVQHQDTSDFYKREVVLDFLEVLMRKGIVQKMDRPILVAKVDELIESKALKGAMLMATIDYVRAVHAEMAALLDAARNGVSVAAATMYTTTFPCHDCTKHIVAAGIARVVFVEPYTKSLTSDLFADSVSIDDPSTCGYVHFNPFIGVLPRRYADIFAMRQDRKDVKGMWIQWRAEDGKPGLGDYFGLSAARIAVENAEVEQFNTVLKQKGIVPREG